MALSMNGADKINLFALVIYIPDPLATFLDQLRTELVPVCMPHAHVTILPPRPLSTELGPVIEHARSVISGFAPFDIVAGEVEIFPETDVIFIGLREGERELRELYRALNQGPLAFRSPFEYHPHITLAQDLTHGRVKPLYEVARQKWAACPHSRRIRAERAEFVQATTKSTWVDLADFRLAGVPVR
ncbi:MAG TPA: 2'-5' RNA ligase family protein [Bryobacteraceae bacterium]|nr:2'-5' RNA ligase family protein [Bryobacteraceae bacterium]